jgi:hypothetical protein
MMGKLNLLTCQGSVLHKTKLDMYHKKKKTTQDLTSFIAMAYSFTPVDPIRQVWFPSIKNCWRYRPEMFCESCWALLEEG